MEMLLKFLFLPIEFFLSLFGIFDEKKQKRYEFYYMLLLIFGFIVVMVYYWLKN